MSLQAVVFADGAGTLFEIAPPVVSLLHQRRQKHFWNNERGGLLFMQQTFESTIRVMLATPPHRKDKATRASLILDRTRCSREIKRYNDEGLWLIGYWHTHAENEPRISPADVTSFRDILHGPGFNATALMALIVGNADRNDFFSAYILRKESVEELRFFRLPAPDRKS
ncbi:MAG: Mov34/MPN/PAD-1 family protein [Gammaproteobacteria bacterium]|nr:Mov34/MPN/PAD-1 family protein [Gammaproteobacteria bacterium]